MGRGSGSTTAVSAPCPLRWMRSKVNAKDLGLLYRMLKREHVDVARRAIAIGVVNAEWVARIGEALGPYSALEMFQQPRRPEYAVGLPLHPGSGPRTDAHSGPRR